MSGVAQGVAGGGVLQADDGGDVAGVHGLDILPVVGVHLKDAADALTLLLGGVEHRGAGIQHTGVHTDEGQTASSVSGFTPWMAGMSTGEGM